MNKELDQDQPTPAGPEYFELTPDAALVAECSKIHPHLSLELGHVIESILIISNPADEGYLFKSKAPEKEDIPAVISGIRVEEIDRILGWAKHETDNAEYILLAFTTYHGLYVSLLYKIDKNEIKVLCGPVMGQRIEQVALPLLNIVPTIHHLIEASLQGSHSDEWASAFNREA